ncbi:Golgin subfamily A member 1 [Halotydeus destructor]|nr:Golgin subfamily A member 1 [Halotydeus destructor]
MFRKLRDRIEAEAAQISTGFLAEKMADVVKSVETKVTNADEIADSNADNKADNEAIITADSDVDIPPDNSVLNNGTAEAETIAENGAEEAPDDRLIEDGQNDDFESLKAQIDDVEQFKAKYWELVEKLKVISDENKKIIQTKMSEIGRLSEDYSRLENSSKQLVQELGSVRKDKDTVVRELEKTKLELLDTEKKLDQSTKESDKTLTSKDNEIRKLSKQSSELESKYLKLSVENEKIKQQSKKDCDDLKGKVSKLETELSESISAKEHERMLSTISKLSKVVDSIEERNSQLSKETEVARAKSNQEADKLRAHVAELEVKCSKSISHEEHEKIMKEKLDEIVHLTRTVQELETAKSKFTDQIEHLRQTEFEHCVSRDAMETEMEALKMRLNELEDNSKLLMVPLSEHEDLRSKFEETLECVEDRNVLLVRNAELSQKIESHIKQQTASNLDIQELESNLKAVQSELLELKDKQSKIEVIAKTDHEAEVSKLEDIINEKNKTIKLQQQRISDIKKSLIKGDFINMSKNEPIKNSTGYFGDNMADTSDNGSSPRMARKNSQLSSAVSASVADDTLQLSQVHHEREINFQYLKNVVYKFITNTDSDSQRQLIKAISVLLEFSPDEEKNVRDSVDHRASWLGGLPLLGQPRRPLGSSSSTSNPRS